MASARATAEDRALLDAARDGDEGAFQRLIEAYRPELHAHCYRMLGSVHDAEDALQESLLRAWRGIARFEGRSSLRSWLYTIATNTCLNAIEKRPKRVLPVDYGPAADPHVPANQRAALILREVLGFSAKEVAEQLDTSVASVNSALQRARAAVEERVPEQTQQATLRTLGDDEVRELVERWVSAWERNDVDAMTSMLAEDATFTMPPLASWYEGRGGIEEWARNSSMSGDWRWKAVVTRANGQ